MRNDHLPTLPPLRFDGFTFEEIPLDIYRRLPGEFFASMSAQVALETAAGPRRVRVFSALGAYVVALHTDTPQAVRFRHWAVAEIAQWHAGLLHRLEALEAKIDARTAEATAPASAPDAHAETLRTLATAIAGLYERIDPVLARVADGTPHAAQAYQNRTLAELIEAMQGLYAQFPALHERIDGPDGLYTIAQRHARILEDLVAVLEPLWSREHPVPEIDLVTGPPLGGLGISPKARDTEPLVETPSLVVADGPVTVLAGAIDGHPCRLVSARELWDALGSSHTFDFWFNKRRRFWGGETSRDGEKTPTDYLHARGRRNRAHLDDWFVSLDAALRMLRTETHVKAVPLLEFLTSVARQRGETFEGEASRVDEGNGVGTLPTIHFPADGLVPVTIGRIGDRPCYVVDARSLHAFLEVSRDFSNWIKDRIEDYGFVENQDFALIRQNWRIKKLDTNGRGGDRRSKEYHLTLDMAKELAMVERNEKGREVRQYFIRCERIALQAISERAGGTPTPFLLPDTPPDAPHVYRFVRHTRSRPVRVTVLQGRPAFHLDDLIAAGLNVTQRTLEGLPPEWHWTIPSITGERAEPVLSLAGAVYCASNMKSDQAIRHLREFLVHVETDLAQKAAGALKELTHSQAPTVAQPPIDPLSPAYTIDPKRHYTVDDRLYLTCLDLCRHLHTAAGGREREAGAPNRARLLAFLWRHCPPDGWIEASHLRLAEQAGLERTVTVRNLRWLAAQNLVETRPNPQGKDWPRQLRVLPENVRAAVARVRGGENDHD